MSSERPLRLREVSFKHRGAERYALDNISLNVEKGEFVLLLGPNGQCREENENKDKKQLARLSHAIPLFLAGAYCNTLLRSGRIRA